MIGRRKAANAPHARRLGRGRQANRPSLSDRYSAGSLLRHGLSGNQNWSRAIPNDDPRSGYDVVIVGAGGHGLATAFYLARDHGISSIGVFDKGWLGGGNVTRNTSIVRSNFFLPPRQEMAELSLKMWDTLSSELNFNVMFGIKGLLTLAHAEAQLDDYHRRANAMRMRGIEVDVISNRDALKLVPRLNTEATRFPVVGGIYQPGAGTVRHDAVAWGYARAASALGVDIIQNTEITALLSENGRISGVETPAGRVGTDSVVLAASAGSSHLGQLAGLRLPIENHLLQAAVTEPLSPVLDTILTHGLPDGYLNFYVSQTDKGELLVGGNIDGFNSHRTWGTIAPIEIIARAFVTLLPSLSSVRLMRVWGGVVDMSMDGSPVLGETPIAGLYINAGWSYGGFKHTPAVGTVLAHMVATGSVPTMARPFSLERFYSGRTVSEEAAGPKPWKYH